MLTIEQASRQVFGLAGYLLAPASQYMAEPVLMSERSFLLTAAGQFRILTGFPFNPDLATGHREVVSLYLSETFFKNAAASDAQLKDHERTKLRWMRLLPCQRAAILILDNPGLEEVLLLFQIHRLRHPWEWIFGLCKDGFEADLTAAAVRDKVHILLT